MAIALVQSNTGAGATIALSGVAAGNLLTLQTSYYRSPTTGAAEATPTDTQGTWSAAVAPTAQVSSGGSPLQDVGTSVFYQANVAAGTHTVTPEANNTKHYTLCEWSGMATSLPADVSASNGTNNVGAAFTSLATGTTGTTAQADELVLIALALAAIAGSTNVGFTDPVSGFTTQQKVVNDSSDLGMFHAYKIISATGTQTATFNWTDNETEQYAKAAIATFKATGGAPAGVAVSVAVLPGGLNSLGTGLTRAIMPSGIGNMG